MLNAMLTSSQVADLLDRRTRRTIAILLSYKERKIDSFLPENIQMELRSVILDEINDLASLTQDIIYYFEEK